MGAWHGAICVASRAMIISGKSVWRAKKEVLGPLENQPEVISKTWPKLLKNAKKPEMADFGRYQIGFHKIAKLSLIHI